MNSRDLRQLKANKQYNCLLHLATFGYFLFKEKILGPQTSCKEDYEFCEFYAVTYKK